MKFHSTTILFPAIAATAVVAPKGTLAFVPASPSLGKSTFVQRVPVPMASGVADRADRPMMSPTTPSTTTSLNMNLVNRFFKVAQSNVNNVLNSLEAPEKIMNQAMIDMQNDLVKVRQSYAEIAASQRKILRNKEAAESRAEDWYVRAQLALRSGNDVLAKEALARRQQFLEQAEGFQVQVNTQSIAADKLYEGMQALEAKIKEASQRKNEFIARAKAAESTTKVNDMLSGLTGKTSMDAFNRMEAKVEALEAAAEASAEMANLSTNYLPSSSNGDVSDMDIESEFLLLESKAAVDEEFRKLKTKMLPESPSRTRQRATQRVYDPSIESEFDKLKAESTVVKIPINQD